MKKKKNERKTLEKAQKKNKVTEYIQPNLISFFF